MLQRYHDSTPHGKPAFELLPAIDLRGGRVVRLVRGDFAQETVYGDDPAAVARAFAGDGARWLHVVDLDGARAGEPRQRDAVRSIVTAVGRRAQVEVAGGLREAGAADAALGAGAARIVLGTAALADPDLAGALVARHGAGRVAVALDVRDGLAVGEGWRAGVAGQPVESVFWRLVQAGVETFEVTAVARDGTLAGPDLTLLGRLVALGGGRVIASGGIGTLDDLRRVRDLGCGGAILGRALYDGRFRLAAAIDAVR